MKTKIGQLADPEDSLGLRDAVHVPVVLVTTDRWLIGGGSVRFTDTDFNKVSACVEGNRHAIVDPFVDTVKPGDKFLVLLVPSIVTKLVHHYDLNLSDVPTSKSDLEAEQDGADEDDSCRGCW